VTTGHKMGGTIVDSRKDKERTTIVKKKRKKERKKNRVITKKMKIFVKKLG
jgi:hypothetical protein